MPSVTGLFATTRCVAGQTKVRVVEADVMNDDEIMVSFSDGRIAFINVEELLAVAHNRFDPEDKAML
jgi:hypothetical protein